jgi:hypothetical protein
MGLIGLTEGLEQPDQASEVSTTDETSSGDCTDRIQHHKERKKERKRRLDLLSNSFPFAGYGI